MLGKKAKASNLTITTITKKYVEGWFSRTVGKRGQPSGQNSFLAPYPSSEFQIDLFFINDLGPQKLNTCMVCVDNFSKYAVVVPLQGKDGEECAAGIIESLEQMRKAGLKKPKIIYTDDDRGFSSDALRLGIQRIIFT